MVLGRDFFQGQDFDKPWRICVSPFAFENTKAARNRMNYEIPPATPEYVYYNPMSNYLPAYAQQGFAVPTVLGAPGMQTPPAQPEPAATALASTATESQPAVGAAPPAVPPPAPPPASSATETLPKPVPHAQDSTAAPSQGAIVIPPPAATPAPVVEKPVEKPHVPGAHPIPEPVKETTAPTTTPVRVEVQQTIDPCCSLPMSAICLGAVGLTAFLIIVTITSVMVFGNGRDFCNGYVRSNMFS